MPPRRSGSSALVLGSVAPASASLQRSAIGANRLNAVARQRAEQARGVDLDEVARVISELFPNPDQAAAVAALRTSDGQPFFTVTNKALLLEATSLEEAQGFEAMLTFLQSLPNADGILKETPLLEEVRQKQQREDELLERNEQLTEGIYECPNKACKSQRIAKTQKQMRSADEGMDVFLRCSVCPTRWRERG